MMISNTNISKTPLSPLQDLLPFVKIGYETSVAFNLKRNQKGVDFLIPIRVGDNFTIWIIQIKNHNLKTTDSNFKVDSTSKLMPSYVFDKSDLGNRDKFNVPYLAMYCQLGAHTKEITQVDWEVSSISILRKYPEPTTHYAILGLNSFSVARGKTLTGLHAILNAYIDPYDEIWSNNDQILGNYYIETFLKPWHIPRSKLDHNLLLDEYNNEDDSGENIDD